MANSSGPVDPPDTTYPEPPKLFEEVIYVDDDGRPHAAQVIDVRPAVFNETHPHRPQPHCHPPYVDLRILRSNATELTVVEMGTPHARTREPVETRCYMRVSGEAAEEMARQKAAAKLAAAEKAAATAVRNAELARKEAEQLAKKAPASKGAK